MIRQAEALAAATLAFAAGLMFGIAASTNHPDHPLVISRCEVKHHANHCTTLPACHYDEVTPLDCIWHANNQGNSKGRSFVVINQQMYVIGARP